jgi:hypothetical protein
LAAKLESGEKAPSVTDYVRAFVTALAGNLHGDSHFLGFASRYFIERGGYHGLDAAVPASSASMLGAIRDRLLPGVPRAVADERWEILFTSAVHTLARYQFALQQGTLAAPIDELVEDLVQFLAAGLEAPPAVSR